jgi:ABC-type ATPase involved in cell division
VVVMATHNLALVRDTPYRVVELKGGQIVYDSAQEETRGAAE